MNCIRVLLTVAVMIIGASPVHAQAVSGQGTWETTLQARDVGNTGMTNAFYDTVMGITWLRDANVNGPMDWNTAVSWASNLTVGGISGWRLPKMAVSQNLIFSNDGSTSLGYNVSPESSEMANLYHSTLGNFNSGLQWQSSSALTNSAGFQNMQDAYWLAGEYTPSANAAWMFEVYYGGQFYYPKGTTLYAMAVHPGDVGNVVATIPEPETYAMLLAGLGLIGVVSRRRAAKQSSKWTSSKLTVATGW